MKTSTNVSWVVLVLVLVVGITPVTALDTVVGETIVDLDGERAHVRTGETNLGNLMADMMLAVTDADLAFTNGGGIRTSVPAGPITMEQILEVHPFSNVIVTVEMTGRQILEALEHGVSQYPEHWGGFPQVSGFSFTFDPALPVGERIVSLETGGGTPDPDRTYVVATNDFLAAGGDGYVPFENAPLLQEFVSLDIAMIEFVRDYSPLNARVEGRINRR